MASPGVPRNATRAPAPAKRALGGQTRGDLLRRSQEREGLRAVPARMEAMDDRDVSMVAPLVVCAAHCAQVWRARALALRAQGWFDAIDSDLGSSAGRRDGEKASRLRCCDLPPTMSSPRASAVPGAFSMPHTEWPVAT